MSTDWTRDVDSVISIKEARRIFSLSRISIMMAILSGRVEARKLDDESEFARAGYWIISQESAWKLWGDSIESRLRNKKGKNHAHK
jgi:hypothetical protein